MSEFHCRNWHMMTGNRCPICGGSVVYMDGMSGAEIEARENYEGDDEE